jgi:hypothetical protein
VLLWVSPDDNLPFAVAFCVPHPPSPPLHLAQPPAPTTPFLNCAPYEAELRSSLLVYCQDTGQCANALSALAQAQAGPSVPRAAS